jgi:hypothetical protein
LLLIDANNDEQFTSSAKIILHLADEKISQRKTYIDNFTEDMIDEYKNITSK